MMDDSELLRRYVSDHSGAAFGQLVERRLRFVYACALRRVGGDAHSAQDVAQTVFIALARHAEALQQHKALTGWLYTATRNASAQLVRSSQRRQRRETEALAMNETSADNGPAPAWEQVRPLLDRALDDLPDGDRDAVLLRFFENRSYAEIGFALQLTENTARMRVERALDKLQRMLARHGVTSSSTALGMALASQQALALPAGLATHLAGLALAQTTAATTTSLAITTFMGTAKWIAGTATLAAMVAVGIAVSQRGELQEAQHSVALLQAERDALAARLAQTEARPAPVRVPNDTQAQAPAVQDLRPSAAPAPAAPATASPAPSLDATKAVIAKIGALRGSNQLDAAHIANIRTWARQDPEGLVRWLGSVPGDAKQREHSIEAALYSVTESDPELAFLLANSIEREVPRMNRLSDVVRAWAPHDPAAAERTIAASDLTPEIRQRLLRYVEHAKRLQGGKL